MTALCLLYYRDRDSNVFYFVYLNGVGWGKNFGVRARGVSEQYGKIP